MKILVIGSGGREHALAWRLAQSPRITEILVAPGNAGTAREGKCRNVAVAVTDIDGLLALAQAENVAFTLVGPEAPLVLGVVDLFQAHGLRIFGPRKAAAQLEGSKAFAKDFLARHGIPTAHYAVFDSQAEALAHVDHVGAPIVIKADGLAAGKGVIVAMTLEEALEGVETVFSEFGDAGAEAVIEEFMEGEEASYFLLVDGETVLAIGTAQDHKRVGDGDTGPNTGGMGAYSPAPVLTDAIADRAMREIILPTIAEMARRGTPYQGVLYAGLMIKDGQGRLVEYNARFGDPECQVLMMRLGAQALDLLLACAEERLSEVQVNWAADHALTVVMAAKGYPGAYKKGTVISGVNALPDSSSATCFHAGTAQIGADVTAQGGRVLHGTARAASLREARAMAYDMVDQIDWPEGFCRRDIGWRAL